MTSPASSPATVSMDRAGRLVLPKSIRAEAGFEPGVPLLIRVRDGRVEIEPAYPEVRLVERDGFTVAERVEPGPVLTGEVVRRVQRDLREGNPR